MQANDKKPSQIRQDKANTGYKVPDFGRTLKRMLIGVVTLLLEDPQPVHLFMYQ